MNAEPKFEPSHPVASSAYAKLVHDNFGPMEALTQKITELETVLTQLQSSGGPQIGAKAKALSEKLKSIEPSITMIGQVKAGKTSLVNAMVGWPGLLPADVNPWTSVVTSLHLSTRPVTRDTKAQFQFFEQTEWDRLVVNGGRVGEIASRAGAENEVEKVRKQIEAMQEKSRRRLGRKYELLLGQSHDYGTFDSSLIERYVCLGDDFDDQTDVTRANGRFADITKSADLYLERAGLPMNLAVRDTPGVNDTFMVREQITIRAIRDSRICVVVLSAHQALSSVDMALIRLISNVEPRQVVIFVNRIDELPDPAHQVPEIQASIEATLRDLGGPSDFQIIFGSAHWATAALQPKAVALSKDSVDALKNWGAAHKGQFPGVTDHETILWKLSGVPALFAAIAARIQTGPGQDAVDQIARRAQNLAHELKSTLRAPSLPQTQRAAMTPADAVLHHERLRDAAVEALRAELSQHIADFESRMQSVHANFLSRATSALIDHLDLYGEDQFWTYDPTGLRMLLRSAYQLFAKRVVKSAAQHLTSAAAETTELLRASGFVGDASFRITPPDPVHVPPPVVLGQTIALDLKSNWWSKWWRRRRGHSAFADEFYELVKAESLPILTGLSREYAVPLSEAAQAQFAEFMQDQLEALQRMSLPDLTANTSLGGHGAGPGSLSRETDVDHALQTLGRMVA